MGDPLSDQITGRDHWLCPACGTFDGPISYRRCDACEERPEVRAMIPAADADHLRAENKALKTELARVNALARDRDDFLFAIGKVIKGYEESLFATAAVASDEKEDTHG